MTHSTRWFGTSVTWHTRLSMDVDGEIDLAKQVTSVKTLGGIQQSFSDSVHWVVIKPHEYYWTSTFIVLSITIQLGQLVEVRPQLWFIRSINNIVPSLNCCKIRPQFVNLLLKLGFEKVAMYKISYMISILTQRFWHGLTVCITYHTVRQELMSITAWIVANDWRVWTSSLLVGAPRMPFSSYRPGRNLQRTALGETSGSPPYRKPPP